MNPFCVGLVLLLFYVLFIGFQQPLVEGIDNSTEQDDEGVGEDSDTEEPETLEETIARMEQNNYLDETAFLTMAAKGMCTNEPNTDEFHTCEIKDAAQNRQTIDLRYVNLPPSELNTLRSNVLNHVFCPQRYSEIMKGLDETTQTFDYARAGYSSNAYLDRTRYYQSSEPLPVNPDFFLPGGGTFA